MIESSDVESAGAVVLDASVWVSRNITSDSNHNAARLWVASHLRAHGTVVAPMLFQLEITSAISRVTKDPLLARKQLVQLDQLSTYGVMRFIPVETSLLSHAVELSIEFGLRAADAIYAALARELDIPLVSFDAESLSLPVSVVTTTRP